ncbi:MAG: precorrin-3B C(17)-methyltransferase, partial [Bradyrhizobium sp.]|nr:precorrin-3B C(17)-methyltransferase [Bradyrhizobium sp.]
KPWAMIEKRLRLAAEADFAIAMYNPRSASRLEGFGRALAVLKDAGCGGRLVIFARAISAADESIETVTLNEATPEMADMRTLVIVGNSQTRRVGRWVYAPRRVE